MCSLLTRVKHPTSRIVKVHKCISVGSTDTTWMPLVNLGSFPRGRWVRAAEGTPGFNCYRRPCEGYWSTDSIQCRARFIEGYGKHDKRKVLFAREIFVPRGRCKSKGGKR